MHSVAKLLRGVNICLRHSSHCRFCLLCWWNKYQRPPRTESSTILALPGSLPLLWLISMLHYPPGKLNLFSWFLLQNFIVVVRLWTMVWTHVACQSRKSRRARDDGWPGSQPPLLHYFFTKFLDKILVSWHSTTYYNTLAFYCLTWSPFLILQLRLACLFTT